MSKFKNISSQMLTVGLAIAGTFGVSKLVFEARNKSEVFKVQSQLDAIKAQEDKDKVLGQYAINMMYHTSAKTKLSDAKKQILARAIVRVSNDVFESDEHKRAFVAVLAIESEFQRNAQSPTGPRGLSQVAKSAFKEGMDNCGVGPFSDEDVWETDINLYAGACYFRALLEESNDPYVAIVAYNQGPNSKDSKTYAKYGRMESVEALKYVARFNFLKRTVPTDKAADDAPTIKDFPKSTKAQLPDKQVAK